MEELLREAFQLGQQWSHDMQFNDEEPINFNDWLRSDEIQEKIKLIKGEPKLRDCSTCEHFWVSKYVEPCYGCRDNGKYDNYEEKINEQ